MRIENGPLDIIIWKSLVTLTRTIVRWNGTVESLIGVGSSGNRRAESGEKEYDNLLRKSVVRGTERCSHS